MTRRPELDIDPIVERRAWRVERVSWIVVSALLILAVAGAFGQGPLGSADLSTDRGHLTLEYGRVEHREADATLTLRVRTAAPAGGDVAVLLTGGWLDSVDLRGVVPEPAQQVSTAEGLQLLFRVDGAAEVPVSVSYRAQGIGLVRGGVSASGESLEFRQLILP